MIADTSIDDFPNVQSGRFQIVALIGAGGAGKVYKAIDTTLNKTVAIKTLHSVNSADAVRFQREAKLAGVLKHSNVMQVYDFGFTQKQEPYLVLEYVEGKTLEQRLKDETPIPLTVALKIFSQIAAGLSHAHSNQVIHRDIKPGNVILVEGEDPLEVRALIVDFGLAKQQDETQALTAPGIGMGTPRYMSPEQIRCTEVDHRSDIYSFGCLMFQTLTGASPFDADSALELLEKHLSAEPPSLRDTTSSRAEEKSSQECAIEEEREYSEDLEAIVSKCLQKSADQRYQSADNLYSDLLDEFQRELIRSDKIELFDEVAPPPPLGILPGIDHNTGLATKRVLGIPVKAAILFCIIAVGLLTLIRAGYLRDTRDVPLKSRADDDRMLNKATYLPVSAVYQSKTGITELWAENDELLKSNLKGLHATRMDLSNSTFTPQGFRDAETSEAKQINFVGARLTHDLLVAFVEPRNLSKIRIGSMGDKFNSDDIITVLSTAKKLRRLAIEDQALTTHDFKNIVKLNRLQELDLSKCKGITADKLVLLKKLPDLESLSLDDTGVTDKEIHVIAALDLKFLGLKNCNSLTPKGFDELGRMKHLSQLNLRGTSYPDDYIQAFQRHKPEVIPDRHQPRKAKMIDYTEYSFAK